MREGWSPPIPTTSERKPPSGGYYFGQQDYVQAIEHHKKATELAPSYSPAYNILGYAYRQAGDYANAEQAFKKYIDLIPNDPNPYDSYAELLLKMGKFEESVLQYRKALSSRRQLQPLALWDLGRPDVPGEGRLKPSPS